MKKTLSVIAAVGFCAVSVAVVSPVSARTYMDKQGRVIEAELVSHKGADSSTVVIRKDGKEYEVKVSIFSDIDQKYIRKWMKETPASVHYDLEVDAKKKKLAKDSYVYEIKVKNLDSEPVSDFKIKYLVFMKNSLGKTVFKGDTIEVEQPVLKDQTAILTTEPFDPDRMTHRDILGGARISTDSFFDNNRKKKPTLLGVLVRVYDAKGKVVADWRSPGSRFKEDWPQPKSPRKEKPKAPKVTSE